MSLWMRSARLRRAIAASSVVLATGGLVLYKAPAAASPGDAPHQTPAPLVANGKSTVAFSGPGAHGTFGLSHTRVLSGQTTPVYAELRSLILKTSGLAEVLRAALAPVADRIQAAFVYGSIARGEGRAASDVDIMVVSETLSYADLFGALEEASSALGRTVNPTIYTVAELTKRRAQDNAFISRVLAGPKIWLIGDENALALDNLVASGSLHPEAPDPKEYAGLLRSGSVRLTDARNEGLTLESRFDLAYNAAHALCLAALRRSGYRSSNRYIVFQALPHTLGLGPEVWRVLAKCHQIRNQGEYEGDLNVDERLVSDLITACSAVREALDRPTPAP